MSTHVQARHRHFPFSALTVTMFNVGLLQDGPGGKAGGTDGEGEEAKPVKPGKTKAPIPEKKESPAESSDSEERDSVEEEDSEEEDNETTGNDINGTTDRRRSSLSVRK